MDTLRQIPATAITVSADQLKQAQEQVIAVVRQLESEGLLSRSKGGSGGGDDQYV